LQGAELKTMAERLGFNPSCGLVVQMICQIKNVLKSN